MTKAADCRQPVMRQIRPQVTTPTACMPLSLSETRRSVDDYSSLYQQMSMAATMEAAHLVEPVVCTVRHAHFLQTREESLSRKLDEKGAASFVPYIFLRSQIPSTSDGCLQVQSQGKEILTMA